MENTVSNKLRLLLNELAILNQPEQIEGKFIYNAHTLQRIKQLSSELYLLADLGQGAHFPMAEVPVESKAEVEAMMEDTKPEIVQEVSSVHVDEFVEEIPEPVMEVIPEIVEELPVQEEVVPEAPAVEVSPSVEEVSAGIMEPELNNSPEQETSFRSTLKKREMQISLTRRFEYINNLYSGDANEFAMFIDALETSLNLSEALGIYEREYNARHWQKRAESADDLKQIIKRSF